MKKSIKQETSLQEMTEWESKRKKTVFGQQKEPKRVEAAAKKSGK